MCASIYFRFYYRIIAGRTRRKKFEEFLTEKEIAVFSFQRSSATDFLLKGVKNMKKKIKFSRFFYRRFYAAAFWDFGRAVPKITKRKRLKTA